MIAVQLDGTQGPEAFLHLHRVMTASLRKG